MFPLYMNIIIIAYQLDYPVGLYNCRHTHCNCVMHEIILRRDDAWWHHSQSWIYFVSHVIVSVNGTGTDRFHQLYLPSCLLHLTPGCLTVHQYRCYMAVFLMFSTGRCYHYCTRHQVKIWHFDIPIVTFCYKDRFSIKLYS